MTILIATLFLAQGTADLDKKIAEILPKPAEERFLEIPWRTDLMAVNKELARLNLPLLDPKCAKLAGCAPTP